MAMRSSSRVPAAVAASAPRMAATSDAGRRSRRPMIVSLIPCVASSAVSLRRYRANSRMSMDTSGDGRVQLSDEKAYRVSAPMPHPGAIFTTRRTASAPARWPAARGSPRRVAQRPFPSMTIATAACPRRANQRFHVIEVALERPPAEGGEAVFGLGNAGLERLVARDIARVLQLARVHAQVAVGRLEQRLELVEGELLAHGERAHDRESHPLVNEAVEIRRRRLGLRFHGPFRLSARDAGGIALSHRTSVR